MSLAHAFYGVVAVFMGAGVGALLRWGLGLTLNVFYPPIPMGTLSANLIGGLGVGVAIAYCAHHPDLSPFWRLFIITGFLGGLTTFSSFSAEVVHLLQLDKINLAFVAIAFHLGGSLLATYLGMRLYRWIDLL